MLIKQLQWKNSILCFCLIQATSYQTLKAYCPLRKGRAHPLPLLLQPPLLVSLPPQVQWPAPTRGTGRGTLCQWMLLYRTTDRRHRETWVFFVAGILQKHRCIEGKHLSIFIYPMQKPHLGYNTPSCVFVSSGGSGGVYHSRSQCDSGSRLCFQDNRTPNIA